MVFLYPKNYTLETKWSRQKLEAFRNYAVSKYQLYYLDLNVGYCFEYIADDGSYRYYLN